MEGMLFAQMDAPEGKETEFNEWYDNEHIPSRLAVPGFAAASRYEAVGETVPQWLVVYELSDMSALQLPQYKQLQEEPSDRTRTMLATWRNFTRFTCELVADSGANGEYTLLNVVAFAVPEEDQEKFDDFYDSEHTELLLRGPDWLRVRRYRVLDGNGGPWTHFAVHELSSPAALDSPELKAARDAPKRQELMARDWFAQSGRWLYQHRSRQTSEKTPVA